MVDRIVKVPLREIWKHEAKNFTVWLLENIDILKDAIGLELVNADREQSTGNYSVDILAEDTSGNPVVIENQLEKSNHEHLGKLITYLTAFDAKTAIWIVSEPSQEHINAISWLNESSNCDFYLLKIEGIKIGDSAPAPLITKIVGPSIEAKAVGAAKKDISERHRLRYKFWSGLLNYSQNKHTLFKSISPTEYNWIGVTSGLSGVLYTYWVTQESVRLEIYIDRGKDSEKENLEIFEILESHKEKIESVFGDELFWDRKENYRVCVISKELKIGGYKTPEEEWNPIFEKAVESMMNLEKATKPYISSIKLKK